MVSFPPCKINLGLHVVRKRQDGYHDVETCFYTVPWTDILEIIPSEKNSFNCSGSPIQGNPEDNLCVKAYDLLHKDFSLPPVAMHLHKIIPTGAGLGGGSADAAYTLRLLNDLFDLKLSQPQLAAYASRIGSDCAFFIYDQPMIGTGRGDILEPINIDLASKFLLLVKPDVHVSTATAYSGVTPHVNELPVSEIISRPLADWKDLLQNDFEKSVFQRYPEIATIKDTLYTMGAIYASMSGSGSTVFGIFNHPVNTETLSAYTCWSSVL
ncbi:MAG TPA: 4-(cytidine 5'-diphospho)-2-C-methyl-D-erythritol kinase [Ohtaekwangia sp.]